METTVIVVEFFEHYIEEKRIFKVFLTRNSFEDYCVKNGIQILKGVFGTKYYDNTYSYIVNNVECL